MLILSFNDRQLNFINTTAIITIIIYHFYKNEIYKIKLIQLNATRSGLNLVFILYFNNFMRQIP